MSEREIDGVRIYSKVRRVDEEERFELHARIVEDQRGLPDRIPFFTIRPAVKTIKLVLTECLWYSIRDAYGLPARMDQYRRAIRFQAPDADRIFLTIGSDGIRFERPYKTLTHEWDVRQFDQHPTMPLRHVDGRFVGSDEDWVIALTDHPYGNLLRYSSEIIMAARRVERVFQQDDGMLAGLFEDIG